MDIETKRLLASGYTGVTYDARTDRFTAVVYVAGQRKWLGSFVEAEDAGRAYEEARVAYPRKRGPEASFTALYEKFREENGGLKGTPEVGALFEYGGVTFTFAGLTWRVTKRGKFAFYMFDGECCECSTPYRTLVPSAVSVARGITRRCEDHRRPSNFSKVSKAAVSDEKPPYRRLRDGTLATPERLEEVIELSRLREEFGDLL
jgi:hypothetical protein